MSCLVGGGAWSILRVSVPKLKWWSGSWAISRASLLRMSLREERWAESIALERMMMPSRWRKAAASAMISGVACSLRRTGSGMWTV